MRRYLAQALLALALPGVACSSLAQASIEIPCDGSPPEAVLSLPEPLNQWGALRCTIYGEVLTAKDKWIWSYPGALAPVFLPAQMVRSHPANVGTTSFFKQISLQKLEGIEAENANAKINGTPQVESSAIDFAYRLLLTNNEGSAHEVLFVQTVADTKAGKGLWGYVCAAACTDGASFMLLNFEKER